MLKLLGKKDYLGVGSALAFRHLCWSQLNSIHLLLFFKAILLLSVNVNACENSILQLF